MKDQSKHPILRFLPLLLSTALLTACGGVAEPASAPDDHANGSALHTAEVHLSAEQIAAIGLVTGHMEKRGLTTALKVNGRLVLPPDKSAQVSVLFGGLVRGIPVREGQRITQGQVLATMENMELLQLQQDYLETKANELALRADLQRQQELHDERITATRILERAQADQAIAQAQLAGMAAKLHLFGIDPERLTPAHISPTYTVRSPIAGSLQKIAVTLGQYAEPNTPLFNVVDHSALHIDLNIFEGDVARVKPGQQVVFGHAGESIGHHTATIYAVNKAFESDQQAVLAHAKLDDGGEELFAGMYIDALIATDSTTAWSLPDQAIVNNGDEHYIFVERGPGTYVMVPVRIGAAELGYIECIPLRSVEPEEPIVVQGAYYLLSELTKGSGDHDH